MVETFLKLVTYAVHVWSSGSDGAECCVMNKTGLEAPSTIVPRDPHGVLTQVGQVGPTHVYIARQSKPSTNQRTQVT